MFVIKKITQEHISQLCALEESLFDSDNYPISKRAFRYHIKKNNLILGAFEKGSLIGYSLVFNYKKSARIYSIAIDKNHQRKGIGQKILQEIIYIVRENKINNIFLEVRIDNVNAINAYKKNGFKELKRLQNYYLDGADGIKMELCLED
ncbi:MAG: [ribosomal protein S18]-alanine N-acetyltransferase [Campylobacterota bacterium]|nr:[ribosomal protein S18]-alanine N-acetyltransferase [Campylobacterota bacterium]